MKALEQQLDKTLTEVVKSNSGEPNLMINQEELCYLHNQDDPIEEAERIIDQHPDVEEHADVLFYGAGLGYHIQALAERYPGLSFAIYEPVPEVFFQFLSCADLSNFPLSAVKNIYLEEQPGYAQAFACKYVNQMSDSVCIIELPAYKEIFPDQHREFFERFEEAVYERQSSLNTTTAFEKRWTLNSMLNFDVVLSTPNILLTDKGPFQDKPALLVAAGPSLDEEIETLRHIKENGLAYIFTVGAAINTLIDYGLYPHATCSYDPSPHNQKVFKKLRDRGIANIPLIFGSSIGYEVPVQYPGPKFHVFTSPDQVAPYYLRSRSGGKPEHINDAPSIAVIALQLLHKMGFNPVILVGLNLAYKDHKKHAGGLDYSNASLSDQQVQNALEVEGVDGNPVLTNAAYKRMKMQLEMYVRMYRSLTVINSTRGGARITGCTYKQLDEVVMEMLQNPVVEEAWLPGAANDYDIGYLKLQYNEMHLALASMGELIKAVKDILDRIDRKARSNKFRTMNTAYAALDDVFKQLTKNSFFRTFLLQTNQVANQVLMRVTHKINEEIDPNKKAMMTVAEFEEFIFGCENDMYMIMPVFNRLNEVIRKAIKADMQKRAEEIKLLIVDFENVLTDGASYYSKAGVEKVRFNSRDQTGISSLTGRGIKTIVIAQQKNKIIVKACKHLGAYEIHTGISDKNVIIESVREQYGLDYGQIALLIEGCGRLQLPKKPGLTFAGNDASEEDKAAADYVGISKSGDGIVREIARVLTSERFPLKGTVVLPDR